jgi:hypothetical protein
MRKRIFVVIAMVMSVFLIANGASAVLSGAIFTTESACDGTNVNIFASKGDVYLDGGPAHEGAAGLPDGTYYAKVTEPNGTVLGQTNTAVITVSGGEFEQCYQLSSIMTTASSGFTAPGYDTTTNGGGEYKVWISPTADFAEQKTDNFKVAPEPECPEPPCQPEEPPTATLDVIKYYDANANGVNDDAQPITGWKVRIVDGIDFIRYTPVSIVVEPDTYQVSEFDTVETNWIHTTPTSVSVDLLVNDPAGDVDAEFGNLCLGAGGGRTLGFWSNKNGQATMSDGGTLQPELDQLNALFLRNATGADTNFANYTAFRNWLLSATATNMAYMLSAQLAAMVLNVEAGFVNGSALIYAPGTTSANSLGFATVGAVIAEASASLESNGSTPAGHAERAHQEALKNALDKANNNLNFVQTGPCAFTFAGDEQALQTLSGTTTEKKKHHRKHHRGHRRG